MTTKRYDIFIDDQIIGTTELEKADAPMGVVFGQIHFINTNFGYDFFKNYCLNNNIELADDYPEDKLLSTRTIKNLVVRNEDGIEIKGLGNQINGMDGNEFEITLEGVAYPFFEEEFPHHVKAYNDQFRELMTIDKILEIGIDEKERLFIKPKKEHFTLIYRTATEVHWDNNGHFLYSPKPREWTYFDWFKQITGVTETECNCKLVLTDQTLWTNISDELKQQIIEHQKATA